MPLRPGRCTNEMFCTIGASKRVMQLAEDAPFVCPVCGKPLSPPAAPSHSRLVGVTMFGVGVCLAVIGAFLAGAVLGIHGTSQTAPEIQAIGAEKINAPPTERQYALLHSPPAEIVPPGPNIRLFYRRKQKPAAEATP